MLPDIPPQLLAALADAPLAIVMIWMIQLLRRDLSQRTEPQTAPPAPPSAREDLSDFKLEVARSYVPLSLIRDLDSRLSLHLVRIEEKLDDVSRAATAAAAVSGQPVPARRIGFTRSEDSEA